jgi:PTH1 family peptidyl-tRNA hydrolase
MIYTLIPLGNPGEKYAKTRHNIARILLSLIEDEVKSISTVEVYVPETFMNESGRAVSEFLRYHNDREIVVMYDDKDLPVGTFRIAHDRGDGGHNGLKNIIESLGKTDFTRIRIGIAPSDTDGKEKIPPHGEEVGEYVLSRVTAEDEELIRVIAKDVAGAIKTIAEEGYQKAMERYNRK